MYVRASELRPLKNLRMWPPIVFLTGCFLASVSSAAVVDGEKGLLTLGKDSDILTFLCPPDRDLHSAEGDLMAATLSHVVKDRPESKLVFWNIQSNVTVTRGKVKASLKPKTNQLQATMNGVTCYDTGSYECKFTVDSDKHGVVTRLTSQQYTFNGSSSRPEVEYKPMKGCYEAGDTLSLNCTTFFSSHQNQAIVWEGGKAGGPFTPLDTPREPEPGGAAPDQCGVQRHLAMSYTLQPSDNDRIFRCRVGQLSSQFIVAVNCGPDCLTTTATAVAGETAVGDFNEFPDTQDGGSVGKLVNVDEEKTEGSGSKLLVLLTAIPCGLALILVSMALVLRQWRKQQQPQPLVVLDSPPPSEYSGYTERRLPDLPYHDQTTPKWIADHTVGALKRPSQDVNASIYVSMDKLHKQNGRSANWEAGHNGVANQQPGSVASEEGMEPHMRSDRSESVYSNSEAIGREEAAARREASRAESGTGSGTVSGATSFVSMKETI